MPGQRKYLIMDRERKVGNRISGEPPRTFSFRCLTAELREWKAAPRRRLDVQSRAASQQERSSWPMHKDPREGGCDVLRKPSQE
jgi:hypothetical protein